RRWNVTLIIAMSEGSLKSMCDFLIIIYLFRCFIIIFINNLSNKIILLVYCNKNMKNYPSCVHHLSYHLHCLPHYNILLIVYFYSYLTQIHLSAMRLYVRDDCVDMCIEYFGHVMGYTMHGQHHVPQTFLTLRHVYCSTKHMQHCMNDIIIIIYLKQNYDAIDRMGIDD